MSPRTPGRYNLHRLGWAAFEDLCMQVLRVVLGETCTRFRTGPDGGRDGWFEGIASKLLVHQSQISGAFVVQCKHTSSVDEPLEVSHLKKELEKVRSIAATKRCNYLLMTNRQVPAQREKAIRDAFEALPGVERCLVLAETWLEDTVDAHPRLLRLVPRLYGIGDLSQIVAFVLEQQTRAVLEDLARPLRTFVPTDSYRRAEAALHDHGFVVLVGPPASGKSAIAANLCLVSLAQNAQVRVLRIEHADQFKNSWSPNDANTIYWVDDVFGETTLDETRLREWSTALEKVEAARRRGAQIVFCTRDYILVSAERLLKRSKADIINDARVRVDVTALSGQERESILYNHIKDGTISRTQKSELKRHLPSLAMLGAFTPELARRLGSARFNRQKDFTWKYLRAFFEEPVDHFSDVIHGLAPSEKAALAVCLHAGNALPDPVPDSAISKAVLETYGVSRHDVRVSLEALAGSLVKRSRQATSQLWQLHHPSMIEALQLELAKNSSQLVLYLQSVKLDTLLRDTTTVSPSEGSRLVFVPDGVYGCLIERLRTVADPSDLDRVAAYLVERASPKFVAALDATAPDVVDRILAVVPHPDGSESAARLACHVAGRGLVRFDERRRSIVETALRAGVEEHGWLGFLDIVGIEDALPGFSELILQQELTDEFSSLKRLYEWYSGDLSDSSLVDGAIEGIDAHCRRLREGLAGDATPLRALSAMKERFDSRLSERQAEIEEGEQRRADAQEDDWRERYYEERYELEHGRFADVDE